MDGGLWLARYDALDFISFSLSLQLFFSFSSASWNLEQVSARSHPRVGLEELRKVLIATLEYEIIDWKLKVKIGGLGVMSSLMGKSMMDVDLIWVVPKDKDLEYPPGDPIEIIIFGEPYLIEVEKHVLDNVTYVILDSPIFRAQTKVNPYPARMDDLSSAIFYPTWNQVIAATVKRNPDIDIYHINDYHGALVPLYLLPKVIPICLFLHNTEFQGLWPLRTKEEMKEVCSAFNISKEHCTKYVQFGNTFNLLHAAASFISNFETPSALLVSRTSTANVPGPVTPLSGPSNTSTPCQIRTPVISRRWTRSRFRRRMLRLIRRQRQNCRNSRDRRKNGRVSLKTLNLTCSCSSVVGRSRRVSI